MNADTLAEALQIAEALDAQVELGGGDLDELAQGAALLRTLAAEVERLGSAVPAGWKLVPVEPTDDMLINVDEEVGGHCHSCTRWKASFDDCRRVWAEMLAASPATPSAHEPQGSGVGGE